MKSTVEPLEGNKVKLSVEVDETEFDKALDAAFRKIAREVRIPGFRPGKAPRKVLEARLGAGVARGQALQDALPDYYIQAVREHEVDIIAAPEIDITAGEEEGPLQFDAVVEVRPVVTVGGYQSLRVTVDSPVPTDEEIDEQIEALRKRFAELESADRPAIDDDVVTIDINGTQNDEELAGLTAEDFSYEVGSGQIVAEVDEQLRGAKVGDILEFDAEHPSPDEDELHFRILVKDVQQKVLPDLDDAFAEEASEFETLAELREDLMGRLEETKRARSGAEYREKVGEALADLVEEDIPEPLVDNELRQRVQDMAMRFAAQGMELGTWLQVTGQSEEQLLDELRPSAETAARVDLALRAIAEAREIEITDEDLDEEYQQVADRLGIKIGEVRKRFERADEVQAIRSDLKKRRAFEWLLEQVEIVDPDGNPIERSAFEPPDELLTDSPLDGAESPTDAVEDDDTSVDSDSEEGTA